MVRKKLIDHNALIQDIETGRDKQAIMQKFGLKTLGALKTAYLDALVALDKVPAVKQAKKKKKVDHHIGINNRGTLVIPKKLVDALNLDDKMLFKVEQQGADLLLKAIPKPPRTILRKKSE